MRNYKAEYARRIASGASQGYLPQPGPRPPETKAKPLSRQSVLRGRSQTSGCSSPSRCCARKRAWPPQRGPRRFRPSAFATTRRKETSSSARAADGSSATSCRAACCSSAMARLFKSSLATSTSASKIGRFMSAVSQFLRTNNPAGLREFEGVSVTDVSGKTHPFETRPNRLYRLASAHDQSFEHIYRIVV